MDLDQIKNVIKNNLKSVFEENDIQNVTINDETEIFGTKSVIDSLQLVNLIVKIETELYNQTGEEIMVVDDEAIIIGNSPFQTVKSLSSFVFGKVQNV